ncbi:MAG: flagellar basal body-associated FliL family protein [Syntrophobacteraceae bacterium]
MPPEVEQPQETPQPKGSSKKKLLLLLVVFVLMLGGGGAGAYFKFFAPHKDIGENVKEEEIIIKEMETFIVNLSDPGGKRFLKITMKAKLNSQPCLVEFGARNFEMRDICLMVLSGKEVVDIATPEDKINLKQQLVSALNRALRKGQVQDIYFTDFLIQ